MADNPVGKENPSHSNKTQDTSQSSWGTGSWSSAASWGGGWLSNAVSTVNSTLSTVVNELSTLVEEDEEGMERKSETSGQKKEDSKKEEGTESKEGISFSPEEEEEVEGGREQKHEKIEREEEEDIDQVAQKVYEGLGTIYDSSFNMFSGILKEASQAITQANIEGVKQSARELANTGVAALTTSSLSSLGEQLANKSFTALESVGKTAFQLLAEVSDTEVDDDQQTTSSTTTTGEQGNNLLNDSALGLSFEEYFVNVQGYEQMKKLENFSMDCLSSFQQLQKRLPAERFTLLNEYFLKEQQRFQKEGEVGEEQKKRRSNLTEFVMNSLIKWQLQPTSNCEEILLKLESQLAESQKFAEKEIEELKSSVTRMVEKTDLFLNDSNVSEAEKESKRNEFQMVIFMIFVTVSMRVLKNYLITLTLFCYFALGLLHELGVTLVQQQQLQQKISHSTTTPSEEGSGSINKETEEALKLVEDKTIFLRDVVSTLNDLQTQSLTTVFLSVLKEIYSFIKPQLKKQKQKTVQQVEAKEQQTTSTATATSTTATATNTTATATVSEEPKKEEKWEGWEDGDDWGDKNVKPEDLLLLPTATTENNNTTTTPSKSQEGAEWDDWGEDSPTSSTSSTAPTPAPTPAPAPAPEAPAPALTPALEASAPAPLPVPAEVASKEPESEGESEESEGQKKMMECVTQIEKWSEAGTGVVLEGKQLLMSVFKLLLLRSLLPPTQ